MRENTKRKVASSRSKQRDSQGGVAVFKKVSIVKIS